MVAYSGGKCLRGPQCAGLLLGRKDLLQAAWINSAPHHAFGRSLKVGKEEIMGMLAAVEMWVKRDHDAEWKTWESWLAYRRRVTKVPGVTTEVHQPQDLSNHSPMFEIKWDAAKLGITGKEVEKLMLDGKPRIMVGGASGMRPDYMASSMTIMPYMMMPEDHKIAADALYAVFPIRRGSKRSARPRANPRKLPVSGSCISTICSGARITILPWSRGAAGCPERIGAISLPEILRGSVAANEVLVHSSHRIQGTSIEYAFTGTVDGDSMSGTVSLGEYGPAKWSARRRNA